MRLRILILTTEPLEQGGGMEHFIRVLANGLRANGYLVEVFHRDNCLPVRLRFPSSQFARYGRDALLGWYIGRRVQKVLDDQVVAVLSNSTVGWYPLRGLPKASKKLHFCHGTYRAQAEAIRPMITRRGYLKMKWWDSMVLERASCHGKLTLCNSEQTREEVKRFFGCDAATVWCPLDTTHFRPIDRLTSRATLGLSADCRVGLFVGNAQLVKNFSLTRHLIESLPQIKWLLALRGEIPPDLECNPNVRVFQDASYDQLPGLYGAADFSVCPSRYESFGFVVAEALACGTPVIASPGGASRLFLRPPPLDRLLISDPDSVEQFRSAILEVLSEPALFRRVVLEWARPQLEEFMTPANWIRRFADITGLNSRV
jgi:glycosyltransferase involved in cell wall biosynthesis